MTTGTGTEPLAGGGRAARAGLTDLDTFRTGLRTMLGGHRIVIGRIGAALVAGADLDPVVEV